MIRKFATAVILVTAIAAIAQQKRVTITEVDLGDGTMIQLNMVDSLWQYSKSGYYEMDDDGVYIDLRIGGRDRIMWVKPDGTWTYVTKKPRTKTNKLKTYPALNVSGVGTNAALDAAMKASHNAVYVNGSANLRKSLPTAGIKDADKILQACLRDKWKENSLEQSHKQLPNKQWQYTSKLDLYPYQVKEIMDCFEEQVELQNTPAAPAADAKK